MYKRKHSSFTHQELLEEIEYDPETGLFWWKSKKIGRCMTKPAGTYRKDGYHQIFIHGLAYLGHRLAWYYVNGEWPEWPSTVDHRDLNRTNNRWDNLRLATPSENSMNCPRKGSKLKGAFFDERSKRWYSKIQVNHKVVWLGCYDSERQAHEAYAAASEKYHGEFGRTE